MINKLQEFYKKFDLLILLLIAVTVIVIAFSMISGKGAKAVYEAEINANSNQWLKLNAEISLLEVQINEKKAEQAKLEKRNKALRLVFTMTENR